MTRYQRWIGLLLAVCVLAYAALAGCRTLQSTDLGWQLAAGRYIFETGEIPRQDLFSYTAAGKEWIYPPGGQLLFYRLLRWGGYRTLNSLGILACLLTTALLLVANLREIRWPVADRATMLFAALAVPGIAARTAVRADLFTTVLFTAVLILLWGFHRGLSSPLYLLPFLFLAWANLHQGFIFGLALLAAAILGELAAGGYSRSRSLLVWGGASALAVLINPFGWRLYSSLWRVRQDMAFQRGFIAEASAVPFGWWRVRELIRFHDPDSGFWMLAALGVAGLAVALARRRLFEVQLLAGALLLGLSYARAQALLVIPVVVVLPGLLSELPLPRREATSRLLSAGGASVLLVLVVFHSANLVSSRYYVARGDTTTFGLGVSWFFPERALDFIEKEQLPGRLYNDYNLGGWTMWRLWPRYRVYIDGRAAPFTPDIFLEQQLLTAIGPGSGQWQSFLDRWRINTLLVSLARYGGYRLQPVSLCASPEFRLVYIDEVSGVWLRVRPENRAWLERLGKPCPSGPLPEPPAGVAPAARYNFLANAGQLYHALGLDGDAFRVYAEAQKLYLEDANLHWSIAQIWHQHKRLDEARREYRLSLAQRDSSQAWLSLGLLEAEEGHHAEAAASFARSAERAVLPHESYRLLGEAYLALREPQKALMAFEKARASSRYRNQSAWLGRDFLAAVEDGRQRAQQMLRQELRQP